MARNDKKRRRRERQQRLRVQRERKKKRQRKSTQQLPVDDGFAFHQHPLSNVPRELLQEAMLKFSEASVNKLPALQAEIENLAKNLSPTYFLGSMVLPVLFRGMSATGDMVRFKSTYDKKLLQFHLELAQGVFLRTPPGEFADITCDPHAIQEFSDKLFDVSEAFQHSRYGAIKNATTPEQRHLLFVQERIRLHTHGVRNWGYFKQVVDILQRLFAPLDPHCHRLTGMSATGYISAFKHMLDSAEQGMNAYVQKLAPVFRKTKLEEVIKEYTRQFGMPETNNPELLQLVRERQWTYEVLRSFILSHSVLHLMPSFHFARTELASLLGITDADVSKGMTLVSLKMGALVDFPFEHLFLGNPVWEKPVLEEESLDRYFCCLPQLFFAFAFHIFDRIFSTDPVADKAHADRRSRFLQSEVEACFASAFGDQTVFPGERWTLDGVGYESDLLIRIDAHLFIIELKSNQISWPALRGAPERLKRHIQELLIDPATQSGRLESALRRRLGGEQVNLDIRPEVLQGQISEITRVSVTLEDFATIQSDLKEIKACGFDLTGSMPVTMSLADLQTVFAILDNPIERLFYLHRRQRLQDTVSYLGDEIDLLALYLATGLDLGEIEQGQIHVNTVGMSEKIDGYFQALDQGISHTLPRRKMGKWFADIVTRLTARKIPRWTEIALMLLSLRFEQQEEFEKYYARVKLKLVKQSQDDPNRENITMLLPPQWRAFGFACVAYFEGEDRHQLMENAASLVFERSGANRCLVLARDMADRHYPYSTLAVFERPRNSSM